MAASSSSLPPARPIDLRTASTQEYARLSAFYDQIRVEQDPDDPTLPLEDRIRNWRNRPAFMEVSQWIVPDTDGETIVASGSVSFLRTDENAHLAEFDLEVLPAHRRRGLGRQLLNLVAAAAEQEQRRLLITGTSDRVPAGAAFVQRIGAVKGLESHVNQLRMSELDRDLVARWLEQGRGVERDFELGYWDGHYPEADLAAIADLNGVMNQAPRGDLGIEDMQYTPAFLREAERTLVAGGVERWTAYVRERSTRDFAGFSEVYWHPGRPTILQQGGTAVVPRFRGRALGSWLKAAMLERIMRERPQVEVVRTSNADSNAPMLRINTALGFRPYMARTAWQLETAQVRRYLADR